MCVPRRTNSFILIMDKHLVNPKSVWERFGGVSSLSLCAIMRSLSKCERC